MQVIGSDISHSEQENLNILQEFKTHPNWKGENTLKQNIHSNKRICVIFKVLLLELNIFKDVIIYD